MLCLLFVWKSDKGAQADFGLSVIKIKSAALAKYLEETGYGENRVAVFCDASSH